MQHRLARISIVPELLTLAGFDFGTTTSSAVFATARVTKSRVSGRMELTDVIERYRSPMIFTPMKGERLLDLAALQAAVLGWLSAAALTAPLFGGGALLTGLAAQSKNASELITLLRGVIGEGVVATADDPRLESWLAFMGGTAALSRAAPQESFLNLDIGGGTTNLALGSNGEITATGCVLVGARHVRVVPGSYVIAGLSSYAQAAFAELGIRPRIGEVLERSDVDALLGFYEDLLFRVVSGAPAAGRSHAAQLHVQAEYRGPYSSANAVVTFSGGVGALMSDLLAGKDPGITPFGDLGVDLARSLLAKPRWSNRMQPLPSQHAGRVTSMGMMRHATMVSGASIYLPRAELLPMRDLPLLGVVNSETTERHWLELLSLIETSRNGGCFFVVLGTANPAVVRKVGDAIAKALRQAALPADRPIALLVDVNAGKALGHYATAWGAVPAALVVIDEIEPRAAQFVRIGAPAQQVVPVSFFGMG